MGMIMITTTNMIKNMITTATTTNMAMSASMAIMMSKIIKMSIRLTPLTNLTTKMSTIMTMTMNMTINMIMTRNTPMAANMITRTYITMIMITIMRHMSMRTTTAMVMRKRMISEQSYNLLK